MAYTLVQFDFPYAGPWGADMATAMGDLAQDIAGETGLVWKIWTENEATGRAGGIYVFDNPAAAAAYTEKHSARLAAFGITGINAQSFDVNAPLSTITRAPL
ncbi:monooxygenase [Pseudodonghicola flavimaris]|uniref:Monooxygenase n=1 Tax=Pseudodonghicola flavimaris TaxID=3050036 RepID=A0ABT7EZ97_9RHOB|nr:monooxygenase [Pseudodonghicola flavimaris]MDK3017659.1 monooxygenase [Pseudodonghicola flavimaris]